MSGDIADYLLDQAMTKCCDRCGELHIDCRCRDIPPRSCVTVHVHQMGADGQPEATPYLFRTLRRKLYHYTDGRPYIVACGRQYVVYPYVTKRGWFIVLPCGQCSL